MFIQNAEIDIELNTSEVYAEEKAEIIFKHKNSLPRVVKTAETYRSRRRGEIQLAPLICRSTGAGYTVSHVYKYQKLSNKQFCCGCCGSGK